MEEKNQVNNIGNKLSEDQLKIAREKKLLAGIFAFFFWRFWSSQIYFRI